MSEKTRTITVHALPTPPPEEWQVPPSLQGLSCVLCGFPFKDGDTHGELDTDPEAPPGQLICRTRKPR